MMTKNAATQYAPEGIRVNCVHPGAMAERVKVVLGAAARPAHVAALMEDLRKQTPLGRLGTASDIAWAVRYLLSEESSFVTGLDLVVDGGFTVK
jgi:3alpha(or 20beta)-hydroxysteroid dehydrogenase